MKTTILLTATPTKFIASETDLDAAPTGRVALRVPPAIFCKAVGLAEALDRRFRAPHRQYFPAQCEALAETLSGWLANQQETEMLPRTSRLTPVHHLGNFFAIPGNRTWLERLIAFAAASRGFTVED